MKRSAVLGITLFTLPLLGLLSLAAAKVVAGLTELALTAPSAATPAAPVAPATTPVEAALPPVATLGDGALSVTAKVDRSKVSQRGDGLVQVQVQLTAASAAGAERVPTDMIVVLDVSGSMSGPKLADAKSAVNELVDRLGAEDRFALVTFSNDATERVSLGRPAGVARRALAGLHARGGTNMDAGLREGLRASLRVFAMSGGAGRAPRMVLISDGQPDTEAGLADLARQSASFGVPMSAVGIGPDYNERLMSSLADHGAGNFFWATADQDLSAVFDAEFAAARGAVAKQVSLELATPAGVQLVDAAGLPTTTTLDGHAVVALGSLYGGQQRSVWLTLRVPTGALTEVGLGALGLRYTTITGELAAASTTLSAVTVVADRDEAVAALDPSVWEQAVVQTRWGALKADVAERTQRGDQQGAKQLLSSYRQDVSTTNDAVGSAVVRQNMADVDALERELDANYEGADQASRRNLWSKGLVVSSQADRRSGASPLYRGSR